MTREFQPEDYLDKITTKKGISGVRFFEGKKALTKLLHFPLYVGEIGLVKSLMDFDILFSYLQERDLLTFMEKRIDRKMRFRIIRKRKQKRFVNLPEYDEKELREKRFLPDDFELSSCFLIFGKYVSIFTIVGKPYGVLIKDEYYRKTIDSIFENLWQVSERPQQDA